MGNTYPNHKGNYYYRNHTLCHIGTLDPLGYISQVTALRAATPIPKKKKPEQASKSARNVLMSIPAAVLAV